MGNDLILNGKTYISAVRAAKKVGYANDYVGQLCRSGKINATLIGKTWYVEFDSLLNHRKTRKLGKRRKTASELVESRKEELIDTRRSIAKKVPINGRPVLATQVSKPTVDLPEIKHESILKNLVITYEKDDRPRIPELSKTRSVVANIGSSVATAQPLGLLSGYRNVFVAFLIVAVVIPAAIFGLYQGPAVLSKIRQAPLELSLNDQGAFVKSAVAWFDKTFRKAETKNIAINSREPSDSHLGIAVVPEGDDSADAISRIKRAFSDDVDVQFDEAAGSESGVIVPVFREGDDTEGYAFLLVPVNEKKEIQ